MPLPGLDLDALTAWMDRTVPGLRAGPLSGEVIAGGKSNLTYRLTDGITTWALRRPPLGHVLPTAHDMAREYRVISALTPTDVPVPPAVAFCEEEDVLGAKFYLMEFVDGVVLDTPEKLGRLDEQTAGHAGDLLIDTLLALHAVDPSSVGLADFGRPDGYLQRQLKRWHQQWQASETRPLEELDTSLRLLTEKLPEQSAPGIVHGDYRLSNVIFAPGLDRIAAVVDWEMATVGDPLVDVGLLTVYHQLALSANPVMPPMTPDDGFRTPDQLLARYAAGSPRDVGALSWYVSFGFFKLAVIAEGIAARYLQGKTVGAGFDMFQGAVPMLLRSGIDALTKE